MKILYLANARVPSRTANSMQVMKVCAALASLGHEVELVVPRFQRGIPSTSTLEEHYGVPVGFPIRWLGGWRPLGRVAWESVAAVQALRAGAGLYLTRNERVAAALARGGRATVLEAHQPPAKLLDRVAWRALVGAPGLRLVVAISRALAARLVAAHPSLDPALLRVEHDGVDLGRFRDAPSAPAARARLGWGEASLTAGYAGHLYAGRGVETILALAARFPGVAFKLMGGEPEAVLRVRGEALARGLANVELLGFVPNQALPLYLAACDVLLMPYGRRVQASGGSETGAFASPLKMFEYMAAGRAILASRLPGVLEVLHDENAVLCEPDDLESWAAGLARVAEEGARARVGARARADVEPYAWDRRMERIVSAATGLAGGAAGGGSAT